MLLCYASGKSTMHHLVFVRMFKLFNRCSYDSTAVLMLVVLDCLLCGLSQTSDAAGWAAQASTPCISCCMLLDANTTESVHA
jgi:hypothetical protein